MPFMHIDANWDNEYETYQNGGWTLVSPANVVRFTAPVEAGQGARKTIVFIHSHSCTTEEAQAILERMMTAMERNWGRNGQTVDADWVCLTWNAPCSSIPSQEPQDGRPLITCARLENYFNDLYRITMSFPGITTLLRDIAASGRQLHIIAHGIGCRAVDRFLETCVPYGFQRQRAICRILDNIRTVSMIAPDVEVVQFSELIGRYVPKLWKTGRLLQISVFVNSKDWATWAFLSVLLLELSIIWNRRNALRALNDPEPVASPDGALEVVDVENRSWGGYDMYDDRRVVDRISYRIATDGDFPPESSLGATIPARAPQVIPELAGSHHEVLKFRNQI